MKWCLLIVAAALAGCATTPGDPAALARQHDRNVAEAQRLDYLVMERRGETLFCATHAPTGSHVVPGCVPEAQWEREHLAAGGIPVTGISGVSGRCACEGTLGY